MANALVNAFSKLLLVGIDIGWRGVAVSVSPPRENPGTGDSPEVSVGCVPGVTTGLPAPELVPVTGTAVGADGAGEAPPPIETETPSEVGKGMGRPLGPVLVRPPKMPPPVEDPVSEPAPLLPPVDCPPLPELPVLSDAIGIMGWSVGDC